MKPKAFTFFTSIILFSLLSHALLLSPCFRGAAEASDELAPVNILADGTVVTLTIVLSKNAYRINEPIIVECKFKNCGTKPVVLAPIWHETFWFIRRHITTDRTTRFSFRLLAGDVPGLEYAITLAPGSSQTIERRLGKEMYWMPLVPGDYELWAVYENTNRTMGGVVLWRGEVGSNVVRFNLEEDKTEGREALTDNTR